MKKFEVVSKYKNNDIKLPERSTKESAGYDLCAAEDILVQSYFKKLFNIDDFNNIETCLSLSDHANIIKKYNLKPTMVPTGIKACMDSNEVLKIYSRSSIATKNLVMLANNVGIIDADYYNNPDNEGHIFVPLLNFSPYDILIKKGDKIAQGIFEIYDTINDDKAEGERKGGFGSTGN